MKILRLTILIAIVHFIIPQIARGQVTLTIDIANIQNQKGDIHVQVYNVNQNFPKGKPGFQTVLKCNGIRKITATFSGLENGYYAISIFQDINGNGKFDRNFIGMPKEPYALSKNYHPKMSAPSFEDCKIMVDPSHTSFTVNLVN